MFLTVAVSVSVLLSVVSQVCGDHAVAFSAVIKNNKTIAENEIVAFDHVLINYDDKYDNKTGVFTVPKPGAYIFHMHAVSKPRSPFLIGLYKNEEYVISEYGLQKDTYASGGNTVILPLETDDIIYLKAELDLELIGSADNGYATFSGLFIG